MLWDANVALWLACRWRRRAVSQGVIAACFVRLMRGLLQSGVGGEGLMGRVSVIVVAIMLGRFAMVKRGPLVVFGRILVVLCALVNLGHDGPSLCADCDGNVAWSAIAAINPVGSQKIRVVGEETPVMSENELLSAQHRARQAGRNSCDCCWALAQMEQSLDGHKRPGKQGQNRQVLDIAFVKSADIGVRPIMRRWRRVPTQGISGRSCCPSEPVTACS